MDWNDVDYQELLEQKAEFKQLAREYADDFAVLLEDEEVELRSKNEQKDSILGKRNKISINDPEQFREELINLIRQHCYLDTEKLTY